MTAYDNHFVLPPACEARGLAGTGRRSSKKLSNVRLTVHIPGKRTYGRSTGGVVRKEYKITVSRNNKRPVQPA
jgi:hypothetical protein